MQSMAQVGQITFVDGMMVTCSADAMPGSWFAYDAEGRLLQAGVVRNGYSTHSIGHPVLFRVARDVFRAILCENSRT